MRLRDLLVHIAVTLGYVLVGLAIAAGVVTGHHGSDTPSDVRIVAHPTITRPLQRSTADWLGDFRRDLAIRPDQVPAWQSYANTMADLEISRDELERELVAGGTRDVESERARHAMVVANALAELNQHLSPEQQTKARLLTVILAASVICRELGVQ
jgi:hypothetical protein